MLRRRVRYVNGLEKWWQRKPCCQQANVLGVCMAKKGCCSMFGFESSLQRSGSEARQVDQLLHQPISK